MMVDGEIYKEGIKLSPPEPLVNLSVTKRGTTAHCAPGVMQPEVLSSVYEGLLPNKTLNMILTKTPFNRKY